MIIIIIIYTHMISRLRAAGGGACVCWRSGLQLASTRHLGTKYCTLEIDTSEIIVDFQWHLPTDFHFSVEISLSQWIFTRNLQWTFTGTFQFNGISLLRALACNLLPRAPHGVLARLAGGQGPAHAVHRLLGAVQYNII